MNPYLEGRIEEISVILDHLILDLMNDSETDKRWASIAKTDLQTGLMAARRSVENPGYF